MPGANEEARVSQAARWANVCLVILITASCHGIDHAPPPGEDIDELTRSEASSEEHDSDETAGENAEPTQLCVDKTSQPCSVTLADHDGIVSCYHGQQLCEDGNWGVCGEGNVSMMQVAKDPVSGLALLSLGAAEDCQTNPCDPDCRTFFEQPTEPYEAARVDGEYPWTEGVGSVEDYLRTKRCARRR